jgi:hypothetical protein
MSTPRLLERLRSALASTLAGYGAGEAAAAPDFCVSAMLADPGLEGALLMAGASLPLDPKTGA